MNTVISLIATLPRETLLKYTSLPSIAHQTCCPDAVVLVSDRCRLTTQTQAKLQAVVPQARVHYLHNMRVDGAAGAWNTGLDYIRHNWPDAYVAILDDDDAWDVDHIATCKDVAEKNGQPDVVVSGLRMNCSGVLNSRMPPATLKVDDFLVGNPGWQGSNTFAKVGTLLQSGGFTDGLTSCNDRDLAIRLLSLPNIRIACTGRFTATWNFNASPDSLSRAGPMKRDALRQFYAMHGHRMSTDVKQLFLKRCMDLFGVSEDELL